MKMMIMRRRCEKQDDYHRLDDDANVINDGEDDDDYDNDENYVDVGEVNGIIDDLSHTSFY